MKAEVPISKESMESYLYAHLFVLLLVTHTSMFFAGIFVGRRKRYRVHVGHLPIVRGKIPRRPIVYIEK